MSARGLRRAKLNPRHSRNGVQTAIEMLAGLDELNAQWEKKGIAPLKIGVDIHSHRGQVRGFDILPTVS